MLPPSPEAHRSNVLKTTGNPGLPPHSSGPGSALTNIFVLSPALAPPPIMLLHVIVFLLLALRLLLILILLLIRFLYLLLPVFSCSTVNFCSYSHRQSLI